MVRDGILSVGFHLFRSWETQLGDSYHTSTTNLLKVGNVRSDGRLSRAGRFNVRRELSRWSFMSYVSRSPMFEESSRADEVAHSASGDQKALVGTSGNVRKSRRKSRTSSHGKKGKSANSRRRGASSGKLCESLPYSRVPCVQHGPSAAVLKWRRIREGLRRRHTTQFSKLCSVLSSGSPYGVTSRIVGQADFCWRFTGFRRGFRRVLQSAKRLKRDVRFRASRVDGRLDRFDHRPIPALYRHLAWPEPPALPVVRFDCWGWLRWYNSAEGPGSGKRFWHSPKYCSYYCPPSAWRLPTVLVENPLKSPSSWVFGYL